MFMTAPLSRCGLLVEPRAHLTHFPGSHSLRQFRRLRKFRACNQSPECGGAEGQGRGTGWVLGITHQLRLPDPSGIRQVIKIRDLCSVHFQLCQGLGCSLQLFTGRLRRWLAGHLCDSGDAQRAAMASGCLLCDGLKVRANQMCKFKPSEPNRTGGILLRFSGYL